MFPDAGDLVRRFCGMPWSNGAGEHHELMYYDGIESDPNSLTPVDVLVAAPLNPNLGPSDRAFFIEYHNELTAWLAAIPIEADLVSSSSEIISHLQGLATVWPNGPSLSVLSKVLHRKRPYLIPLVDRRSIDTYRPITGERVAVRAWPGMLSAMAHDLQLNWSELSQIGQEVYKAIGVQVSPLRLIDITIWMNDHR